mmetsp:Transcript_37974/g.61189  ORF Transcript_37974/g.61189 Transcript_37974/m.61189 type:complete len:294 (-) Transcript_37974:326-1207(-)
MHGIPPIEVAAWAQGFGCRCFLIRVVLLASVLWRRYRWLAWLVLVVVISVKLPWKLQPIQSESAGCLLRLSRSAHNGNVFLNQISSRQVRNVHACAPEEVRRLSGAECANQLFIMVEDVEDQPRDLDLLRDGHVEHLCPLWARGALDVPCAVDEDLLADTRNTLHDAVGIRLTRCVFPNQPAGSIHNSVHKHNSVKPFQLPSWRPLFTSDLFRRLEHRSGPRLGSQTQLAVLFVGYTNWLVYQVYVGHLLLLASGSKMYREDRPFGLGAGRRETILKRQCHPRKPPRTILTLS